MNKKLCKQSAAWILLFVMFGAVFCKDTIKAEAVTPSDQNYNVYLDGSEIYLRNEKPLSSKVGTEYYLTYTVKSIAPTKSRHGLVGTGDATRKWPYEEGGLIRYSQDEAAFLDEGATYFIKFTVAKGGFLYQVTRAKGNALEDLYLEIVYGAATDEMKYFGAWFDSARVNAELTNVRCYDANGNDLGVYVKALNGTAVALQEGAYFKKDTQIGTWYDIRAKKVARLALSNLEETTSSQIFIEYKVEASESKLTQTGVSINSAPEELYPHSKGLLKFISYEKPTEPIDFLEVGAEYIIRIDRSDTDFIALVQKTKGGKMTLQMMKIRAGACDENSQFISLWFGEGNGGTLVDFKLTKFKMYDANKKNLKVQGNQIIEIINRGQLESYAGCEAAYYCKENGSMLALYENQTFKFTKDKGTKEGKYSITDNAMTISFSDGRQVWDYLYKRITDKDGNVYERLYNYKVNFVTGSDTKIETQTLSNESGYIVTKPEDPVLKDCEFQGWCTSDGKDFDFASLVTESTTLYAKWTNDGGVTFISTDEEVDEAKSYSDYVLIGGGATVFVAALAVCVIMICRGVKGNDKKAK